MRFLAAFGVVGALLVAVSAPQKPDAVPFKRVEVTTRDLLDLIGVDAYKFQVDLPKGARFGLQLRQVPREGVAGRTLFRHEFEKTTGGPAEISVGLLGKDRKMRSALLSDEELVEFRIDCKDCSPTGLVTFVENPSTGIAPDHKMLFVSDSPSHTYAASDGASRLLVVGERQATPKRTDFLPRVELVITKGPLRD